MSFLTKGSMLKLRERPLQSPCGVCSEGSENIRMLFVSVIFRCKMLIEQC